MGEAVLYCPLCGTQELFGDSERAETQTIRCKKCHAVTTVNVTLAKLRKPYASRKCSSGSTFLPEKKKLK